jgi:hypothetical protein
VHHRQVKVLQLKVTLDICLGRYDLFGLLTQAVRCDAHARRLSLFEEVALGKGTAFGRLQKPRVDVAPEEGHALLN